MTLYKDFYAYIEGLQSMVTCKSVVTRGWTPSTCKADVGWHFLRYTFYFANHRVTT